jgi:calcium-dependent protein kinase
MALSCGTLAYVAPEVLDKSYTSQCDMWSFGVVVFIVLFGYMPFYGAEANQVQMIRQGKYNEKAQVWNRVSKEGQDFVRKCLVVDPSVRLTPQAALDHPWVKQRDDVERTNSVKVVDQDLANSLVAFAQASQFRRAAMNMMAWSLTNEERAEVRQAFIDIDTDRSGAISLVEFKNVLEERFHIDHEQAQAAFEALDANHQEEIHYSEFLAAMCASRIKLHDDLLKDTFKHFDPSNSGYITSEDLQSILGDTFEPEEVTAMMQDVNKSENGKISYSEFISYIKDEHAHSDHQEKAAKMVDARVKQHGREKHTRAKEKGAQPGAPPPSDREAAGGQKQCCGIQ